MDHYICNNFKISLFIWYKKSWNSRRVITIKSKLILRFIIAHFKAQVEYRFSFFVNLFVQVFAYAVTFINMWLLFNKINNLNGWTFNQVIFLWNLNVFSYGICGLFISAPTRSIEGLVQSGNFDMLLTKPISPLLHLLLKNLSVWPPVIGYYLRRTLSIIEIHYFCT